MHRQSPLYILLLTIALFLLTGCTMLVPSESAESNVPTPTLATAEPSDESSDPNVQIGDVELLGVITVPNDTMIYETLVGGLSAIAYAGEGNTFYFLSDDRAMNGPSRIYAATVDVSDGTLDDGDLTWTKMIPLVDEHGKFYARAAIDPEGLAYTGDGFYVSTEGDRAIQPPIAPAILHFTPDGRYVESLPLPDKFLPVADGSRGVRNNKGFESLTLTPDGRMLISGVENALVQDGPAATLEDASPSRLLTIDLAEQRVVSEHVYMVDAIPQPPNPANGDADNGLVDLIALDHDILLATERSYVEGVGNTIRIYLANRQSATDVSALEALSDGESVTPIAKELLVDFGELGSALGIVPDNLEGLALGPELADGRRLLLVVSDNNFNPSQTTQLWALAIAP